MTVRRLLLALAVTAGGALLPGVAQAQTSDPCSGTSPNPIACENSKPGTPQSVWDVFRHGDDELQGFATSMSVNKGSSISFKIDTLAPGYRIDIYRLGYYQGDGARLIASNLSHAAPQNQPDCLTDSSTGLIDCGNWAVSASWNVPSSAVSGVYFAKLTRSDRDDGSHITFVVRDDDSTSDVVVQTSDATWHAYNTYGGNSLYQCTVACPPGSPRAYKAAYEVSYNRPFRTASDDNGRSWLSYAEYPMIRFLERSGYDVSYLSQIDTESRPALLRNHRLFVSSGHDEYYSANQRTNVQAARDAGVNLAFFSGNLMFWKTRYKPSIDGKNTPDRTLVSYKDTHFDAPVDPVEWTGTWRDRRFDAPGADYEPENSLTGQSFRVNLGDAPITVPAEFKNLRLWRNTAVTGLAPGTSLALAPSTLGYEWDEDADNGFRPDGQFKLSSTTVSGVETFTDYGSSVTLGTSTHNLTMYRARSGALVFNTGTVQWAWGLDSANPPGNPVDPTMQQATVNLFADAGAQPYEVLPGLVRAGETTDTTNPTATIDSPAAGAAVADGTAVTISGTATDTGGVVAGIEVSTDGGTTWHPARGTTNWTYRWVAHGNPSTTIRVRATDDSGNTQAPGPGNTVEVTCPCSVFGDGETPPVVDAGDPTSAELGVKFRSDKFGEVTGVRFYKSSANTGTHVGSLWSAGGERLAHATFTDETESGWQTVTFDAPVEIQPDTTYVASYFAPKGHYAATAGYFHPPPSPPPHGLSTVDSAPLHGLRNSAASPNGVFAYATEPRFPASSFDATNYWVDVVFSPIPPPGQVTDVTAREAGRTSAEVSWSAPSTGGKPTEYTVTPYIGSFAQPSTTIKGSPPATSTTITGLTSGVTYTFTVRATNPNGVGPESTSSNAITPLEPVAPTTPQDVVARPATSSALVSWTTPASDGDSAITGYTVTPYVGTTAQTPVQVPATDTSTIVRELTNGTSYTFGVTAENDAGSSQPGISPTVTPQSTIFDLATPTVADAEDPTAVELGVKFTADVDGSIAGVRFYKSTANTGTHTGSLWTAGGTRLAQATFTDETATGWQTVTFAEPVPVTAGTVYVASYHAPKGRYSATRGGLETGVDNPPLRAVSNATSANGVYAYGATSTFPAASYNAGNYWVDVLFAVPTPGQPTDVTAEPAGATSAEVAWAAPSTGGAPTSYKITAYAGSSVQTSTTVKAPATSTTVAELTTGTTYTFRVQALNGSGAGPESEASNTVTPLSAVAPGTPKDVLATPATRSALVSWSPPDGDGGSPITGYTVTPYVGTVAQPPVQVPGSDTSTTITELANGTSYTFRVTATNDVGAGKPSEASRAVTPQFTIFDFARPAVPDVDDANAIQLGVKFTSEVGGSVTGVRFFKSAANTGTHVGSLWTAGGTRLAEATFSNETAGGWQTVTFAEPVAIAAGTTYVAAYHAPRGHYSTTSSAFAPDGFDNPPLRALDNATSANGVYAYGPSTAFPTSTFNAGNYWVDVLFAASPPPGTVTDVTATAGKGSASVSWTAPTTGGEPTSYKVTPYIGSEAQEAKTITGSPPATTTTVTGLTPGTAYTFRVQAANLSGNGPDSTASNSVTPLAATPPGAPTEVSAQPDTRSAVVSWKAPSDDGGSAITGYEITPFVGEMPQTAVEVDADQTRASVTGLTNDTSYTFRVAARNAAGTGSPSAASNAVSPLHSIFEFATPPVPDAEDGSAIEVGVKFTADVSGSITGVRFYKSAANTGTHTGSLWSATGTRLAQATFRDETDSGWQIATFPTPVPITAGTTYVASYHAPRGRYSVTSRGFGDGPFANPPLSAVANSVSANGVYAYGSTSTFPTSSFNATNYWVDVLFAGGS